MIRKKRIRVAAREKKVEGKSNKTERRKAGQMRKKWKAGQTRKEGRKAQ